MSAFAKDAMKWCVGAGLIQGNGLDQTLAPQDKVSRAVGAALILRYMEKIEISQKRIPNIGSLCLIFGLSFSITKILFVLFGKAVSQT